MRKLKLFSREQVGNASDTGRQYSGPDSLSLVSRQSDLPMYADSRSWKCVGIKVKEDQKSGVHCWFSLYSQNTISRIHVRTL